MSWSLHVLDGIETVRRTYEFADHVLSQIDQAATGRGLAPSERLVRAEAAGLPVSIPQWWLHWYEWDGVPVVRDGKQKLAEIRGAEEGAPDPAARVGVVVACFWRNRIQDRVEPILRPEIVCGRGTLRFRPWGASHTYKAYFEEFARRVNEARPGWANDRPAGVVGHLDLAADFAWLAPRSFDEITNGDVLGALAEEMAGHMAEEAA